MTAPAASRARSAQHPDLTEGLPVPFVSTSIAIQRRPEPPASADLYHLQSSCQPIGGHDQSLLVSQVWYRRIKDEAANSSLDVDFYFPVDQWLVAREDYHRCAGSWPS